MSLPLIVGDRLRQVRGPRTVLDVDRIEVYEGETLALLGPNGAGKTTLVHLLAMLEAPSSGRVTFRGQTGSRGERELRSAAAVVLERPHLWRESVEYNVGLGLRLRGVPRHETDHRVHRACEAIGLGDAVTAPVTSLSTGQARRVALAQALVLEPEVLFLDEPTSGMDRHAREALRRDLATLARDHPTTLVLATHDRNDAFHLADRVAVLEDGALRGTGSPVALYTAPVDRYAGGPTGAELILPGRVLAAEGTALTVGVAGLALSAVGDGEVGAAVGIGYRPEDLVLGRAAPTAGEISARNLFYATVAERRDEGGLSRVRLRGAVEVAALVSRGAADQLELEPGTRVTVRVKAAALRVYPSAPAGARDPVPAAAREPRAYRSGDAWREASHPARAADGTDHAPAADAADHAAAAEAGGAPDAGPAAERTAGAVDAAGR